MSKIWYCPNCGYEVASRGRCHLCRQRLVASALPELTAGVDADEDEVGYRLEGWVDRERGRLIERLNLLEIMHRFEEDELVVSAEDEVRVDDLVADLAASPEEDVDDDGRYPGGGAGWTGSTSADDGGSEDADRDKWVAAGVRLLADAAGRLRRDPTDMHADADVAEASAAVFMVDRFHGADPETWAAVGRVTRRLLSALGADEAMEDEIRTEAAVLAKLLVPLTLAAALEGGRPEGVAVGDGIPGAKPAGAGEAGETQSAEAGGTEEAEPAGPEAAEPAEGGAAEVDPQGDETVYELTDWLPEQRAQLGVMLDDAGIHYDWDGDDLVVPADREAEVEVLFDGVQGLADEDDDDDGGAIRYRAIEELFAAAGRLAADPADEQRAADVVTRIGEAAGPPPIGMDEIYWFRIMTQARTLAESIGAGRDEQLISEEAAALRDLLRTVV